MSYKCFIFWVDWWTYLFYNGIVFFFCLLPFWVHFGFKTSSSILNFGGYFDKKIGFCWYFGCRSNQFIVFFLIIEKKEIKTVIFSMMCGFFCGFCSKCLKNVFLEISILREIFSFLLDLVCTLVCYNVEMYLYFCYDGEEKRL